MQWESCRYQWGGKVGSELFLGSLTDVTAAPFIQYRIAYRMGIFNQVPSCPTLFEFLRGLLCFVITFSRREKFRSVSVQPNGNLERLIQHQPFRWERSSAAYRWRCAGQCAYPISSTTTSHNLVGLISPPIHSSSSYTRLFYPRYESPFPILDLPIALRRCPTRLRKEDRNQIG